MLPYTIISHSIPHNFTPGKTAAVSTDENGEVTITATIDGHTLSITEGSLRRHLKLADQDGLTSIPTTEKEVEINKKAENQAKMTKLSMEWKRLCKIKAKDNKKVKVKVNPEESAVKPEPELKNTVRCNLNPSDG
ncbi:hypothetical protein Tco_0159261, partial [Tanacetum coccineum]